MKSLCFKPFQSTQFHVAFCAILLASSCSQWAPKSPKRDKPGQQAPVDQAPAPAPESGRDASVPVTPAPAGETPAPVPAPVPVPSETAIVACAAEVEAMLKPLAGIWLLSDGQVISGRRCDVTTRVEATGCRVIKSTQCDGIAKPQIDEYAAVVSTTAPVDSYLIQPAAVEMKLKESSCGAQGVTADLTTGLVFELASGAGSEVATIAYEAVLGQSDRRELISAGVASGLPRNRSCDVIAAYASAGAASPELSRALVACHAKVSDGECVTRP